MVVLELRFPAGRYHATPWGRHVNEGATEWPPSPWRILRAMVATWYHKAQEIPEAQLRELLNALSATPQFQLPRATASHTRHYMPYIEGKNEKTTKVFDTFVQLVADEPVYVVWDVELSPDLLGAFTILAERMGYLGRAESLVLGRVMDTLPALAGSSYWTAEPLLVDRPIPAGHEITPALCPMDATDYAVWHNAFLAEHAAKGTGKKGKGKKATSSLIPEDLFRALHADTSVLQKQGWNQPPGAYFADYTRPTHVFAPPPKPRAKRRGSLPTVARYEVVSNVAPRIGQAISVAERVHDALCKWSEKDERPAPVFSGADADGVMFTQHEHAQIFCEANGVRDAITHITVRASMGFDEQATLALRRLNKVWGHGGHDVRLVLHGIGQPIDFTTCSLFGSSCVWRSATPFVPTRHAKTFRDGRPKLDENGWQIGSAGHDLLRLLAMDERLKGASVRKLDESKRPYQFNDIELRSLQFQTRRTRGGGSRGQESGAAFEITFPHEVSGPIALGYGAHFGLGLFTPVR